MDTAQQAPHAQPGLPSSLYQPLEEEEIEQIADTALEVLEESGMWVYADPALEAFERAGAEVNAESRRVRLPRSLVEDCIASNPSSVTLHSRDASCDAVLEDGRVHYGTGGTALYVLDPGTGQRRPSRNEDVALNARLIDELENVHVFTINVFPNEVEEENHIDVNRFFHSLDNTTKHVMGGIYSVDGLRNVIRMAEEIAGGAEALRREPFVSFITLVISPFKIDEKYGEMTCVAAREGLPVVVPTEPMSGTTAPVTLAGNVLTHVAETLGGIALVQCVNEGAPGICGSVGSISDLRTMGNLGGPIERGMISAAVAQLAQHFELPLYSTAGTSDAKAVDVQAAYESALSSLLVAMSGANYIHDIAGLMEFDLTVSYEKMVVDNEILGMCQRVLRGIEVNEETLAVELIKGKGPQDNFLAEDHTVRHMRTEFFMPRLANREKRDECDEGDDALSRARKFVDRIRKDPPESRLEKDVRDSILKTYPEIRMPEGHA
ncbi:MAG: trimethylamine methyltransferase family protein [Candidatus Brocadiaceae bacterium]|jgi:trimethylamine--corrinoid protein Co-methyltransferase